MQSLTYIIIYHRNEGNKIKAVLLLAYVKVINRICVRGKCQVKNCKSFFENSRHGCFKDTNVPLIFQ